MSSHEQIRRQVMNLELPGWRITSYKYGYQVQRRLNATRWLTESYHAELGQACDSLFKYRVRMETNQFSISAPEDASAARCMLEQLVNAIQSMADELMEAVTRAN